MPVAVVAVFAVVAAVVAIGLWHVLPRSSTARPHLLVQAGDSRTACIYVGSYPWKPSFASVEQSTGVSYSCLETFSDSDPTWAAWVDPWVTQPSYGYAEWLAKDPTERTVIITQDLIPNSEASNKNWRAEGAAGRFDHYARELAINLVKDGFGYSVIRLGHEMNGSWYIDDIGNTPTQWRQWAEYFAQIVKTMRAVPGAHFLFDWNVNARYRDIPLADFYPGNAYVNIVGIDFYDSVGGTVPAISSPEHWKMLASAPLSLDALAAFATAHHKPLSIPEWGTVKGVGDDGAYVAHVGHFVATHDVAYQCWFDDGDHGVYQLNPSIAPRSLVAYAETLGLEAHE